MFSVMNPQQQAAEDTLVALGNTDIVRAAWRPDGRGVRANGTVGGDGAHDAVAVGYLNRYRPNARITTSIYVCDLRDRNDDEVEFPFVVEEQVEFYLVYRTVADPDAQEVWSGYDYHEAGLAYATEQEAEAERNRRITIANTENYTWDGLPFPV